MTTFKVIAKPDFLKSLTASKPLAAVSELVWNGFDAGAKKVQVFVEPNELSGVHAVRIRDDGVGIRRDKVEAYFGGLGDSWKSRERRFDGRALHGKNGKGRFKAFALGEMVEWNTTYDESGVLISYRIKGNDNQLTDFEATDPKATPDAIRGTEVLISNMKQNFPSLNDDTSMLEVTKVFAAYLTEYPDLALVYNGETIDPRSVQLRSDNYDLGNVDLGNGKVVPVRVSIVEWSVPSERVFHLCDASGVALHEMAIGPQIKAPGYNFTVYVRADHFRELDKTDLLSLADLHSDVQSILKAVKVRTKEHFRLRQLADRSATIERWKADDIYPYEDKADISAPEQVERQVFDILAVNVESYLPSFENADKSSRKFTFRLLAQAVRENPESVRRILEDVLGLKKEEQDDLASLLKKTTLSRIISSARVVANRIDFVEALTDLLFNKETKAKLLERDHLHKALENEAWLFREDFFLAGSEKRLEDVLAIHLHELGQRADADDPVLLEGGKQGRIDLMLSRAIRPTQGQFEYLVVELKRPSQPITSKVLGQVESYALAVAKDPRFNKANTKWTFMVVANDMDDHAEGKARQKDRPQGLIYDAGDLNLTVWAKRWSEILDDARARLKFYSDQLDYQADSSSEAEYLRKAHSKYIPDAIIEAVETPTDTLAG
ncbi:MAG: ATP-binding protein [Stagnimonas sp.]|nr:ATP-binding protein [Stagnimonas sp.]